MAEPKKNHALVIGASGVIGWSVVNQLLQPYPSPSPFSNIIAFINRPIDIKGMFWPEPSSGRPEVRLVAGVNLLCSDAEFEKIIEAKVPDVGSISHVYYFAFKDNSEPIEEVEMNVGMMRRVVKTIAKLSSNFQFFVYPGGTRGYGIYRPNGIFSAPLVEGMADELPEDYAKTVAYPHYRKLLAEESSGRTWTWCELCSDAIIGFTPNGSGFSLAGHWAAYLYAYRIVHGESAEVPFPGTKAGYNALYSETSATTLARVGIHASLHPNQFRERIFNVADSSSPSSMRERWPQIASWFGLEGVAPPDTASPSDPKPSDFIKAHQTKLYETGARGVQIWNPAQLDSYGYWLTFDRHLNLARLREAGFETESRTENGWWFAFEMFKKANMVR